MAKRQSFARPIDSRVPAGQAPQLRAADRLDTKVPAGQARKLRAAERLEGAGRARAAALRGRSIRRCRQGTRCSSARPIDSKVPAVHAQQLLAAD
jgi:hypothetical protein